MTDDKIIKTLEEWSERGMTFCNIGMPEFARNILALIDRQKAEIEGLYKINKSSEEEIHELRTELLKRQNLEESFCRTINQFDKRLAKTVKAERAEAIKEFAERLKDEWAEEDLYTPDVDFDDFVDNLAKEMTEGK